MSLWWSSPKLYNTEHDILEEFEIWGSGTEGFDSVVLLVFGLAEIIVLGAGWKLLSGIREFHETKTSSTV